MAKQQSQETKPNGKRLTPKQKAARKRRNIIIFIVELFVLAIVVIGAWAIIRLTRVEHTELNIGTQDDLDSGQTVDVVVNKDVYENYTEPENPMARYMQVALFGLDSRNKKLGAESSRSDVIIIACLDTQEKTIKLVSVYRDTYLNLTNGKYDKCNGAYASGGEARAMTMLNMNLDLYITDYVTVGFWGMIDVIDKLGGVWIDVQENEIVHLNNYQRSIVGTTTDGIHYNATEGVDFTPVTQSGRQLLNGLQATAYCRIRYVGNDYARTERQRKVIAAMMEAARGMSLSELTAILNSDVFDEFSTSIDLDVIISMLGDIGEYEIVESCGFPAMDMLQSGTIGGKGSCVVPIDLTANVSKLHEILFGVTDYEPSATVQEYSQQIQQDTSGYLR
ncbi:MAG: LCP family protein [Lachnospiraceae bacterium]|nr:LCP family protein [Lachnospiraceae bacterium]